eukprot:TRINITY_DN2360_c0_g1_i2.p2 TRINITY_DN2360_c0_g1~~TRINITY_DN2360_c0_g1_i2.p2  ORF type:complete len:196 (-),score=71.80 TRINITY_DN2360_c0_g1_i2:509-1063(-)
MSDDQLRAKVASNDDLIHRLRNHVGVLEHRLRVVLTETKRERENPLPSMAREAAKPRIAESVLRVAPSNNGRQVDALANPELRFADKARPAVPSSSGFYPESGVIKEYQFIDKVLFEEDMQVLRAYLKAGLITQLDYATQRDVLQHAMRGGADFGYQGSNFVHNTEWDALDAKQVVKTLKSNRR